MYSAGQRKFDWAFALAISDVLALLLVSSLAVKICAALRLSDLFPVLQVPNPFSRIVFGLLVLALIRTIHLYSWQCFTDYRVALLRLFVSLLTGASLYTLLLYAIGGIEPPNVAPWLIVHSVCLLGFLFAGRQALLFLSHRVFKLITVERIAFIGWSTRLDSVLRVFAAQKSFYDVVGFFHEAERLDEQEPAAGHGYPPIGPFHRLEDRLGPDQISLLLVDQSSLTPADIRQITDIAARGLVSFRMIPAEFDFWATKLGIQVVAGVPMVGIGSMPIDSLASRIFKRTLDIVGSVVGLILLTPLMGILALLIYWESPGPVLFRQTRVGRGGVPFRMNKLRSMHLLAESESGPVWTVEDDPRRLKIGKWLRAWNLDELPQLWNVFVGEMSLVGPRPERPEFVREFSQLIRFYNLRLICKPGMTGWAAVHGLRGNTSLEERLDYDLYYIENWSVFLDLKIISMTLTPPTNAY